MTPPPEEEPRQPFLDGRTATVSTALVTVVALMMLWVWSGQAAFAAIAVCTTAGLFATGFVLSRTGGTELIGGPLDGARVRAARAERCGELVLVVNGGSHVRYSFDGSGRLIYRGHIHGSR